MPISLSILKRRSRAVAGARVDDHEGPHLRIGRRKALGRLDAHQRIVRRLLQAAAVDHDLGVEHQHRRAARALVLEVLVAALAQDVQRGDGALPSVDKIGGGVIAGSLGCHTGPSLERLPVLRQCRKKPV
jgi:hypothetical protein